MFMRVGNLVVIMALGAMPLYAATADTGNPYAAEDAYMPGNVHSLVTDLNMSARFIAGDKVLYRRGPRGAGQILLADPAGGQTKLLVSESDLKPKLKAAGAQLTDASDVMPFDYDAAAQSLKLHADRREWVYDIASGKVSAAPMPPHGGGFAPPPPPPDRGPGPDGAVSPDGKTKIVARDFNLYAVDPASGRELPLTSGGNYDVRYGTNYPMLGDMAAANSETPPMPVGVQWSEDSKRILTYRLSRNGSFIWHGVQETPPGSRFPRTFAYVYPTAGAKDVPQVQPIVIDVAAALASGKAKITELNVPSLSLLWPGDPPLSWENGRVIYQWTKRGYGEVDLYDIDPVSGQGVIRVHEAVKPVVTVTSSFIRSAPELGGYLDVSERSGWAQLYYIRKGDNPAGGKALTHGKWEVSEIVRVAKDGPILIVGTGREAGVNPYFHSLYSVTLKGAIKNLTPEPLDHRTMLSEDGKWFIDMMSSPTEPTHTILRDASDGRVIMELGKADPSALMATGFTPPEAFRTLADDGKTLLYAMIYRPKNFDPNRKYPVIDYVYTGPTTHNTEESYDRNVVSSVNAMAQIGAIVVVIDGRGTSQRGQAFRLPAFQNMGEVGIDDHIHVMQAMKAKYSYFDLGRVGVYGHSAGGYDAARFILRRPDFFKASIASSGNHDLRLDKAWWPEVSMGLADDATWERNSNIPVAGNLKGKLLIVHGDIDDNVPIAASMSLHKALVDAGKPHEFLIMPNRTHDTYTPYYLHTLYDFFIRNLVEAPSGD